MLVHVELLLPMLNGMLKGHFFNLDTKQYNLDDFDWDLFVQILFQL